MEGTFFAKVVDKVPLLNTIIVSLQFLACFKRLFSFRVAFHLSLVEIASKSFARTRIFMNMRVAKAKQK